MMTRKRLPIIAVAVGVVALLTLSGVAAAQLFVGESSTPAEGSALEATGAVPPLSAMVDEQLAAQPDVQKIGGPDGSVYFLGKADFERLLRAELARQRGEEFAEADLMVPLTDAEGNVAGYIGNGTGFVPKDVAEARGFSPCDYARSQGKTVADTDKGQREIDPCTLR